MAEETIPDPRDVEIATLKQQLADMELRANTTFRVLEMQREDLATKNVQLAVELNLLQQKTKG